MLQNLRILRYDVVSWVKHPIPLLMQWEEIQTQTQRL